MDRKDIIHRLVRDLSGTFIEIGTCWGGFAKFLLDFSKCTKLYCVDPYKKYELFEYFDALNVTPQGFLDNKFYRVQQDLKESFGDRVEMIREESVPTSKHFTDNSLQFVYIDGNHMFNAVMADLEAWYPKIAPGGVLAGDDVESLDSPHNENFNCFQNDGDKSFGAYGVHTALIAFKKIYPEFNYTLEGNQFWWRKPLA
jgi:cephalosporin hydroxylase